MKGRITVSGLLSCILAFLLLLSAIPMYVLAETMPARINVKVKERDGKITCTADAPVNTVTAKAEKKFVLVQIEVTPGNEFDVNGNEPIMVNGIDVRKYNDSLSYISYPEMDFNPDVKKTVFMDVYLYPELWEMIKKAQEQPEQPPVKKDEIVSLALDVKEEEGKLMSTKPAYVDSVTAKYDKKKNVVLQIALKDGYKFGIEAGKPIVINGVDITKYTENGAYISYPEADFDPNVKETAYMDVYLYPDLWSMLNKTSTEEEEEDPTVKPGSSFKPADYAKIYETKRVSLKNMKVYEGDLELKKPIKFVFYDGTTQQYDTTVTSANGMLPDVDLIENHNYIVFAEDSEYAMANAYLTISQANPVPRNYKLEGKIVDRLVLNKRPAAVEDPAKANRVNAKVAVFYKNKAGGTEAAANIPFKLISEKETVEARSDKDGFLEVNLMEDVNYMPVMSDPRYAMDSFPMTIKDKSEWNAGKYLHVHLNCDRVLSLVIFDRADEHKRDTTVFNHGKTTSITGINFGTQDKCTVSDRVLKDHIIQDPCGSGMCTSEYEVVDIDLINMERTEISKMAHGRFEVTRKIAAGKTVKNVYYEDEKGALKKVEFSQNGNTLTFIMPAISLYNNVIEYGSVAAGEYYIVKEGLKWKYGDGPLTVTAKSKTDDGKTMENFAYVKVDDKLVDPSQYKTTAGSVHVELSERYLKNLSAGKHRVAIFFRNGFAETDLTIEATPENAGNSGSVSVVNTTAAKKGVSFRSHAVKTGDHGQAASLIAMAIAVAMLCVVCLRRRKASKAGK